MLDIQALIPLISGVVSAAVQIGLAANKWWQNQKSERAQQIAFAASSPTTSAAKDLNSLMDVQAAYWKSNPGMWQALGVEAANFVLKAYSKSNGYLGSLAQFAASVPDRMDWKSSMTGLKGVQTQLRDMFADHLGKVISKIACGSFFRLLIPKELKERIASENAKLLKQAQASIGLLNAQITAGEQGTRQQLQQYEHQHTQVPVPAPAQQVQPQYYYQSQPAQAQYQVPQQHQTPTPMPQVQYQAQAQTQTQQQYQQPLQMPQSYPQNQQQYQQQTYQQPPPTYTQSQAQYGNATPVDENRADCIIS